MKFHCKITRWGDGALVFLDDPNANFIIIFNDDAPEEVVEFSVLHTEAGCSEDPAVGDTVIVCGKQFTITAIGDEAIHTLRSLGHCTLSFKGGTAAERPGCIMLQGDVPLAKDDIKAGAAIEIH